MHSYLSKLKTFIYGKLHKYVSNFIQNFNLVCTFLLQCEICTRFSSHLIGHHVSGDLFWRPPLPPHSPPTIFATATTTKPPSSIITTTTFTTFIYHHHHYHLPLLPPPSHLPLPQLITNHLRCRHPPQHYHHSRPHAAAAATTPPPKPEFEQPHYNANFVVLWW